MSRKSLKKVLLGELLGAASDLEGIPISEVAREKLLKVAEVMDEAEKIGVRIIWFDRVIGRILGVKDREEKSTAIRERMEVLSTFCIISLLFEELLFY